jgi:hypothetical protein
MSQGQKVIPTYFLMKDKKKEERNFKETEQQTKNRIYM